MGILSKLFGDNSAKSKKTDKKEEKKREWKDPDEQVKYVCQGAKVQCKYCNPPIAMLTVTAETIMLQDKPWATVGDKDGKTNFTFTGVCMHPSQQKPMSPPPPCKSIISLGEWKDFSETVVGNHNALLVKSKIPCMISNEDLVIIHGGQMATPTQINPVERTTKKSITDVYWIDEETGKKMREVREGRQVDLYIKTKGYKEGEQATVKIMASKGNSFEDGSTEMTVSGVVNSDKIALVEKLIIKYK